MTGKNRNDPHLSGGSVSDGETNNRALLLAQPALVTAAQFFAHAALSDPQRRQLCRREPVLVRRSTHSKRFRDVADCNRADSAHGE